MCVCIHAHCLFVVLPSLKNAWDWFDTNCVGTFFECVVFVLWCEQLYSLARAFSLSIRVLCLCVLTHSPIEVHCIIFADNCCLRKWIVLFSAVKISCFTCCAISGDYHLTKWIHTNTHTQTMNTCTHFLHVYMYLYVLTKIHFEWSCVVDLRYRENVSHIHFITDG